MSISFCGGYWFIKEGIRVLPRLSFEPDRAWQVGHGVFYIYANITLFLSVHGLERLVVGTLGNEDRRCELVIVSKYRCEYC